MMAVVCAIIFTRQKYSVKTQVVRFFLVLIATAAFGFFFCGDGTTAYP
jgi:hypothetical protein